MLLLALRNLRARTGRTLFTGVARPNLRLFPI